MGDRVAHVRWLRLLRGRQPAVSEVLVLRDEWDDSFLGVIPWATDLSPGLFVVKVPWRSAGVTKGCEPPVGLITLPEELPLRDRFAERLADPGCTTPDEEEESGCDEVKALTWSMGALVAGLQSCAAGAAPPEREAPAEEARPPAALPQWSGEGSWTASDMMKRRKAAAEAAAGTGASSSAVTRSRAPEAGRVESAAEEESESGEDTSDDSNDMPPHGAPRRRTLGAASYGEPVKAALEKGKRKRGGSTSVTGAASESMEQRLVEHQEQTASLLKKLSRRHRGVDTSSSSWEAPRICHFAETERMKRDIEKHPFRLLEEYDVLAWDQLELTEGAHESWSYQGTTSILRPSFGMALGLWRCHFYAPLILNAPVRQGDAALALGLLVQTLKAIHQAGLDQGGWGEACSYLSRPDPASRLTSGGTPQGLAGWAHYREKIDETKQRGSPEPPPRVDDAAQGDKGEDPDKEKSERGRQRVLPGPAAQSVSP